MTPGARRRVDLPFTATAALLFGAGAAGEAAQVALGGALEEALGGTAAAAVAATLALFAGSGVGATLAQRASVRKARPLLAAGTALVTVGAVELALPRLWALVGPAPPIVRALAGGWALLLPSLATGAIVPVLARASTKDPRGSRRVATLLAMALAGAASGAALTACALLPWRTAEACARIAAIASAVVGALAVLLSRRWPRARDDGPPPDLRTSAGSNVLATTAAAHGFLAGAAALVLAHAARVATHGSAATLGATLAALFGGFAAGAAQTHTMRLHYRDAALVRALAASGLMLGVTLFVWWAAPAAVGVGSTFLGAPNQAAVLALGLALATMTLPSAWIGASFQLLLPHMAEEGIARGAARVAGAGTAGAALGASIAAVLLVPVLGAERALALVALGFAASAALLGWASRARKSTLATAVVTVLAIVFAPRWDTARLAFGAGLPAPPAWAREDSSAGLAATTPGGDFGANGRRIAVTPAEQRTALLATLLAPRAERAAIVDDPAAAAALSRLSWGSIARTPIPRAWFDRFPASLRDARVVLVPAGLSRLPFAADAVIISVPPACGEACASTLATDARAALATDGVALFVVHGEAESQPAPEAIEAVEAAARPYFADLARAAAVDRAIVLAGPAPLAAPRGRLEAMPDGAEARAALASVSR